MPDLRYHLVDVFTDQPFGGNQLAVFTQPPADLPAETMQKIAKELNLSETTFVLPPADPNCEVRVRIFTPGAELPTAGHPTIGTAFVLKNIGKIPAEGTVNLEEAVGVVPVTLANDGLITMQQRSPVFGDRCDDRQGIAEMLSLKADQLADYPVEIVSSGVPFLFIALKNLVAIRAVRFRLDVWERILKDFPARGVFVLTTETEAATSNVHCRMFAPPLGITEDPATGIASGPLGAYLLRYGLAQPGKLISEQGYEMGRPSLIHIEIGTNGETFDPVKVGGYSVSMGEGMLRL